MRIRPALVLASAFIMLLLVLLLPSGTRAFRGSNAAIGGCAVFPSNNIWNTRVDSLPVHAQSATYIDFIGSATSLHPDFGSAIWERGPIGIPYNTVPSDQPGVNVAFDFADESDQVPYPIPASPAIEWGSDHHILILQSGSCVLYEIYAATHNPDGTWSAGSGARFDLNSNALRPAGWTSADAAGLPMLPGLARYDEVAAGVIPHALRFTITHTNGEYVWPARHRTSSPYNASAPPMGQRFRLKASFDISGFSSQTQVILTALKTYGMFVADNGSNWYISGAPDPGWADSALVDDFNRIHGSDFEAVDESSLMGSSDSGLVFVPTAWLWLPLVRK